MILSCCIVLHIHRALQTILASVLPALPNLSFLPVYSHSSGFIQHVMISDDFLDSPFHSSSLSLSLPPSSLSFLPSFLPFLSPPSFLFSFFLKEKQEPPSDALLIMRVCFPYLRFGRLQASSWGRGLPLRPLHQNLSPKVLVQSLHANCIYSAIVDLWITHNASAVQLVTLSYASSKERAHT